MSVATEVLLLSLVRWQNKKVCVYTNLAIYTYLEMFLYITTCIYMKLNIHLYWYLQLCLQVDQTNLLPLITCNCPLQQWRPGSNCLPFIHLIVQFQYMFIVVSKWLVCTSWDTTLSTKVQCLDTGVFFFCFWSYRLHLFPKSVLSASYPHPQPLQWGCFINLEYS